MELYNPKFLWRAGAKLGTMLKIDENTSIHSRGKFARICVEIDLRRQLVPSFTALGKVFYVEYEGLHLVCFKCGRYGHKIDTCEITETPNQQPQEGIQKSVVIAMEDDKGLPAGTSPGETVANKSDSNPNILGETASNQDTQNLIQLKNLQETPKNSETVGPTCFGPWMLVRKQRRGQTGTRARNTGENKKQANLGGVDQSRYAILSLEDDTKSEKDMIGMNFTHKDTVLIGKERTSKQITKGGTQAQSHTQHGISHKQSKPQLGQQTGGRNKPKEQERKEKQVMETQPKEQDGPEAVFHHKKTDLEAKHREFWEAFRRISWNKWQDYQEGKAMEIYGHTPGSGPSNEELQILQNLYRKGLNSHGDRNPPDPGETSTSINNGDNPDFPAMDSDRMVVEGASAPSL